MTRRISRSREDLLVRLSEHCEVLEEFHRKACIEGQAAYRGEIAGKLRVLTYRSRTNRPLLLDLMDEAGANAPLPMDTPSGKYETTLQRYLAELVCAIRLPSGDLAELTRSDLIALWAQQAGASHEDWHLDERLDEIFKSGIQVFGIPIEAYALCGICRTVLHVARTFLAEQGARDRV